MPDSDLPIQIDQSAVADLLDQLAELRAAVASLNADRRAREVEILAAVQPELDALAAEYEPLVATATERAAGLETAIKAAVLHAGHTVKGQHYMAVYAAGRTSWDTKKLQGLALVHPEISACASKGDPTVSFRSVK